MTRNDAKPKGYEKEARAEERTQKEEAERQGQRPTGRKLPILKPPPKVT